MHFNDYLLPEFLFLGGYFVTCILAMRNAKSCSLKKDPPYVKRNPRQNPMKSVLVKL